MKFESLTWVERHPRGGLVAVGTESGRVLLWDTRKGGLCETTAPTRPGLVAKLLWLPDGGLVVARRDGRLSLLAPDSAELLAEIDTGHGKLRTLALDGATSRLATGGDDGAARVWDAQSLQLQYEVTDARWPVTAAGFAGEALVLGHQSGYFLGLTDEGRTCVAEGGIFNWSISCLAVEPEGEVVLFGGARGSMTALSVSDRWEVAASWRGTPPRPIAVNALAFSREGAQFVAASSDGAARVYDWARREQLGTTLGEPFYVRSPRPDWSPRFVVAGACFSFDGRWVYTAGFDGALRAWELERAAAGPQLTVTFPVDGRWRVVDHGRRQVDGPDEPDAAPGLWEQVRKGR